MFADLALARRLEGAEAHANARHVDAWKRVYPDSGATWIEAAGAHAMFVGVGSPTTQTFGLGVFQEPTPDDLQRLENFFASRGADVHHEVSPLAGQPVLELLNARGYHPIEWSTVLFRSIGAGALPLVAPAPSVVVRPVRDGEGPLWTEVMVRGWSEYPGLAEFLWATGPVALQTEGALNVLAEVDGTVVAVGAMSLHDGVAILAGACTVPEARRRGAQLALLHYRLGYAAERGCDIAMMCALPGSASQRNAERHGFRVAYTRTKWALGAARR